MTLAGQGKSKLSDRKTVQRFGRYLRARRQEAGLSLRQLGKKSGLAYNTIGQIEIAIIEPRLWTVELLARALGEKPLQFLRGFYER